MTHAIAGYQATLSEHAITFAGIRIDPSEFRRLWFEWIVEAERNGWELPSDIITENEHA